MSSICPKMNLRELLAAGKAQGYEGIEFRPEWRQAHGVELEAPADRRKEAARMIADSGLSACCISPGTKFCHPDPAARDADLEKLLKYVDLAAEMQIPVIRIFGDPIPNTGAGARAASYQVQAEYVARAAERAGQAGVKLAVETHGNFRAFDAGELMYRAGYPAALWVNWHLSHCLRHGEDVDEAYRHVKGRVAHVHFSLGEDKTAEGYLQRQAELLSGEGYDGFFSVEVINPEDSEGVLARHAEWWKRTREKLRS